MNELWMPEKLGVDRAVSVLKAAAEPTRLRILMLLARHELTVKDLTNVLGQSQPRISRHLKLLAEAGLIDRFREGGWVNLRLCQPVAGSGIPQTILNWLDPNDPLLRRDMERAQEVIEQRTREAQAFFEKHAGAWDEIRARHMDEARVEAAMHRMLGSGPFELFVDLGTGTGRVLELFASAYARGIGIDANQAMLGYARSRLEAGHLEHAQVRHGDICNLVLPDNSADAIAMHQVLNVIGDPCSAIREAARILAPGGRMLVADFAPHDHEALRAQFAHTHLGISPDTFAEWIADAGLHLLSTEAVSPPESRRSGGDCRDTAALTVLLWLAEKPVRGGPQRPIKPAD